jgi:feruloyl-CoA synthase
VPTPEVESTSYESLLQTTLARPSAPRWNKSTRHGGQVSLHVGFDHGMPKGVIQTHGMMCAVIAGQRRAPSRGSDEIPKPRMDAVEHISAGNIGFNNNLNVGGTVCSTANRSPACSTRRCAICARSHRSSSAPRRSPSRCSPTRGTRRSLRDKFFSKLRLAYNGATLSDDLMSACRRSRSKRPATACRYGNNVRRHRNARHHHRPLITEHVGLIGLPLPGLTLKLVPNGQKPKYA